MLRILSLIEIPKSGYEKLLGKKARLLDSGTSYQMTGDITLLCNISNISPVGVGLPNGVETMAIECGMVKLSPKIILQDVLYVPGLTCNLISIAQLIREVSCTVTSIDRLCMIQDHTTKSPIGVGKQQQGVRFFKDDLLAKVQVNSAISYNLWHRRMGHPSSQTLLSLSNNISDNFTRINKSDLCDVCLRAKQTRVPFSTSSNKASKPFELVHHDIWLSLIHI